MPEILPTSLNGKHHAPLPIPGGRIGLAEQIANLESGSDEVEIGNAKLDVGDIRAASMAEVTARVQGVSYYKKAWVPFGMLTMLLGESGLGKSAFALCGLVKPTVTGCDWFDHMRGPSKPGRVLWCDTEGAAALNVQRIKDWKLPQENILVPFEDDPLRPVDLLNQEHLDRIEKVVTKFQTKLVVIDSLRGSHDGDENSSRMSRTLQNLTAIAQRTMAAIVVIHHTRKLHEDEEITANASRGSNAIIAMVRSQIGIYKPDKNSDWIKVQMLKENLGLKPNPIGFRIADRGVEFGQTPRRPRKETRKQGAMDWLRTRMKPGQWYRSAELIEDAARAGFSANAVQRAREELGITGAAGNVRTGDDGKYTWVLPATPNDSPSSEEIT